MYGVLAYSRIHIHRTSSNLYTPDSVSLTSLARQLTLTAQCKRVIVVTMSFSHLVVQHMILKKVEFHLYFHEINKKLSVFSHTKDKK